ncbi:hypothetical protein KIN20_000348 [Parelaphostrongylus tenuis]|uniref:Uncharacterized protein n=1 Tax=Parelaphostrongylus tenuis TaxID=148309 RepID=A0AAD5QFY9_PARTN|nr:hypothetical protein KIN20_000348 [Parelaphostrongylus tenuis]
MGQRLAPSLATAFMYKRKARRHGRHDEGLLGVYLTLRQKGGLQERNTQRPPTRIVRLYQRRKPKKQDVMLKEYLIAVEGTRGANRWRRDGRTDGVPVWPAKSLGCLWSGQVV